MYQDEEEIKNLLERVSELYLCEYCEKKKLTVQCERCGASVCSHQECSILFPHHNNSVLAICKQCQNLYNQEIKVYIDTEKISNIKKKARTIYFKQKEKE